jgi:uncharacterized DUF497 family protein
MPPPKLLWSPEKADWLRRERGVSFDDVVAALLERGALADAPHPNREKYPNQRVLVVEIRGEIYEVPYVSDAGTRFLKTMYPSRKARRAYGKAKAAKPG